MKKFFISLFIVAAAICFTSCKNEGKGDAKEGEKTEVKAEDADKQTDAQEVKQGEAQDAANQGDAQAAPTEGKADLGALVKRAKAEGDKWTEAQWKDAFKEATLALKPMMLEMNEFKKKIKKAMDIGDKAGAMQLDEEMEKLNVKYKDLQTEIEAFDDIIKDNPIANKLNDDKAFQEEVKKELGLEDLEDF